MDHIPHAQKKPVSGNDTSRIGPNKLYFGIDQILWKKKILNLSIADAEAMPQMNSGLLIR
jgi:hypothetical protein